MPHDLTAHPNFRNTMARLEGSKRRSADGTDFWMAREIHSILGYPTWREFDGVVDRARAAFAANGIDPSHQIVLTHKMMEVGRGAHRQGDDYFLSRPACYLIAMNGDPSKPEIAAAQAYFATQTRRMEIADQSEADEKRVELREKVSRAVRRVSGVAKDAGVRSHMQGIFHDARYQGLYDMALKEIKARKGLGQKEQLLDRAGALELSAHDFQMNLAADVISKERIVGEQRAINTNRDVGRRVRKAMRDSGATLPEDLPLEAPIKEVRKQVILRRRQLPPSDSST
jgi:DNA-damage-inducible protein D